MTLTIKTFKTIGIIQILIGLGLGFAIFGLYSNNVYSIIHVSVGIVFIISSVLYYFDD